MIVDTLEYALVTAGVGMGIVFFALISLSLMMLVIRAIFADRSTTTAADPGSGGAKAGADGGSRGAGRKEPGPDEKDEHGVPRWALAGAVAYLLEEERERAPWASPWTSRPVRQ